MLTRHGLLRYARLCMRYIRIPGAWLDKGGRVYSLGIGRATDPQTALVTGVKRLTRRIHNFTVAFNFKRHHFRWGPAAGGDSAEARLTFPARRQDDALDCGVEKTYTNAAERTATKPEAM